MARWSSLGLVACLMGCHAVFLYAHQPGGDAAPRRDARVVDNGARDSAPIASDTRDGAWPDGSLSDRAH